MVSNSSYPTSITKVYKVGQVLTLYSVLEEIIVEKRSILQGQRKQIWKF